ncbi:tyrosine-type recombinase/integrase [bacterium]|nr:tyrosine-type recombinase/integrase [bacterium]
MSLAMKKKPRKVKSLSWDTATDLYEAHLRAKRSAARTVEGYLLELQYLDDYLAKRDTPPLPGEVEIQDLREYQCGLVTGAASRTGKALAAGTVARVSTVIAGFFEWLHDEEKIESNPARRLERPKLPDRLPGDVLTVAEMKRLLSATDRTTAYGLRNRAILEVFYATGLRKKELLDLDLSDVNQEERELTVRSGKGGKGRVLPLARSAYGALMDYVERARPSFSTSHEESFRAIFLSGRGRRLGGGSLKAVIDALGEKAGVHLTPHTLRRTFATHLLKNGVSLRHIQILLGHTSLNTTAIYLRLNPVEIRREILLKHPRERFEA